MPPFGGDLCDAAVYQAGLCPAWAANRKTCKDESLRMSRSASDESLASITRIRALLHLDEMCELDIEDLSHGFCNTVHMVRRTTRAESDSADVANSANVGSDGVPVIVKLYSRLAKSRIDDEQRGVVDVAAAAAELTAAVYRSEPDGIVHQFIPGRTLTEHDIHAADDDRIIGAVARKLAHLHLLAVPPPFHADQPLIWTWLDRMLMRIEEHTERLPSFIEVDTIRDEIVFVRETLRNVGCRVVVCHGDFKPSNVMLTDSEAAEVMMIDFELAGPNYRGFDLMKLFRTNLTENSKRLTDFVREYAQIADPSTDPELLLIEARMFEPLTWLEAAIFFFLVIAVQSSAEKWIDLAHDRWTRYLQSKPKLSEYAALLKRKA